MEITPNEGLDYILGIIPKGGTVPATLYVGLFTSATATTVPAGTAVLSTSTGVTEANWSTYARQSISSGSWGTIANTTPWSQTGRGTTGPQVTFPVPTATYSTAINGFFIATALTGGVALFYSNFDDSTAIASLAIGATVQVTPTFSLLG